MRKAISLLLAFALCLSLCACGGNSTEAAANDQPAATAPAEESTEAAPAVAVDELLENATVIDAFKFYEEASGNIVRAESEYDGKAVLFKDRVIEIQKEYIVVGAGNTRIKVYLATEDIITVNTDQYVFVAGTVSNIALGQEFSLPYVSMDMQQGYLVQNPEADNEPLFKNAKQLVAEGSYADAILILYHIADYAGSNDLLLEAVCKASFEGGESKNAWQNIAENLDTAPLTGEELEQIIVGDWRTQDGNNYSVYTENGEYHYYQGGTEANPDIPSNWYIEGNQLHLDSKYTSNTYTIYPFYKNAYIFCIHQSSSNVLELRFHNGPLA